MNRIEGILPPPVEWKSKPSWVKGSPWQLFHQTPVCLGNDSSRPSTQRSSSIWSTHGKYNPSRALVNVFCLLSTTIDAFHNFFWLNWSDVKTSELQSSSFASLSSSRDALPHKRWGVMCGQGLCIGSWVGVIDSLRVGFRHVEVDIILPTIHFSKQLNYNLECHHGHVERWQEDRQQ